ncbi:DNA/RNA polymerase [Cristinia sonorae]|uniref:DNA-directed RNA polymerase n=1 Tax=Cristinia sonorae TaxID=1940300 RepID=A0A8K0UY24_9AGAR|nr:DNA/RNA polymerase [Cristinia sonorae]
MIPLTRNGVRRNVFSISRQSLPRPARLYSSPSKSAQAEAAASVHIPSSAFPHYQPPPSHSYSYEGMEGFLHSPRPFTVVPTPLPRDRESPLNEIFFANSSTQDQFAVINACLHNLHDVPRAKQVFEQLRSSGKGAGLMDISMFNSLLDAYLEMATTKDIGRRTFWIEDICALYEEMEGGRVSVTPNAHTYATMFRLYERFNPNSGSDIPSTACLPTPEELLKAMVDRQISVSLVVSDRGIRSTDQANELVKTIYGAAMSMNLPHVAGELGLVQTFGTTLPDPLEDVPEATPVLKTKKFPPIRISQAEDGSIRRIEAEGEAESSESETKAEVPFHLDNLRKHLAEVCFARRVLSGDAAARQKLLEASVYDIAAERLKHEATMYASLGLTGSKLKDPDLRAWVWEWHQKLQTRIKDELATLMELEPTTREGKASHAILPFLTLLKPEKMSLLTILEILYMQGSGGLHEGMKTARTLISIGKAVEQEYKTEMCKRNNITIPSMPQRGEQNGYFSGYAYQNLHARRVAARRFMEDAEEWTSEWSQGIRVKVGSFLVDNLMAVAMVTRTGVDKKTGKEVSEEQPAFFHSYEYMRGHKLGVIKLNHLVSERMAKDSIKETIHPRHLPMLVKPKPWVSDSDGGYLYNKTSVMRFKESVEQHAYLRRASELGHVELIFAGLDVLGSTPWHINRDVFDVVLQVWNSGERMPKIPPAVFDMPEPAKPANVEVDQRAKVIYIQRHKQYLADKANNHSERCNVNYKVEIARTFLGDTLYFPHNLDFRGRAYPIPPHLNHMGDDLSRALLKFAEAKPLGERGLWWLKVHLANVYGYDKGSFDERAQFTEEHLADVYDSAERPLEGNRWWAKADDPWQCLATCMELRNALNSPNPHEFLSTLPVHQDGTCNGLQHYAALGGDSKGARQVNLDVTDRPADVYTFVADMVKEQMKKDIAAGNAIATKLDGKITRKVVKQTVMTTVYGVTYVGARDQIERQLKDRGDIPAEECWECAAYLAKLTLRCIGDLFSGAKAIQIWLNVCARIIAKSIPKERIAEALSRDDAKGNRVGKEQMTSVVWTTPMGLPIVQPYRQIKRKQVHTSLQTIFISDPTIPAAVNSAKQASAFPPNFVHSLDATHMMLTALECKTRDVTFASVHDSYWTHACSVDEMSGVIRDTFIALHSRDILANLAEEFKQRYKDFVLPISSVRSITNPEVQKNAELAYIKMQERADIKLQKTFAEASQAAAEAEAESDAAENEDGDVAAEDADPLPKTVKRGRKKGSVIRSSDPELDQLRHVCFNVADLIPAVPEKGAFDVKKIKKSRYFFS